MMTEEDGVGKGSETGPEVTARVLQGSAFIMGSRVLNALVLFIVSVTLARYLGTERYGLIAIAMGVAGMLEVVGSLGINTGASRYIPYYKAKGREDDVRRIVNINVASKISLAILMGALLYVLAGLFQDFFDKPVEPLMQIAAIVLACNVLGSAFISILRGFQRYGAMAAANVVRDAVWLVVAIGLVVVADWGPEGALWGYAAGAAIWLVLAMVAMAIALRSDMTDRSPLADRFSRPVVWALITFGVPALLSKLLFMVFDWTGTYVIAFFGTVEDVSVYNIAFGIVAIPLVLIKAISVAMMPAMAQAYGEGRMGLMQTLFNGSLKLINSLFMPLAAMLMVLAAPAILMIYGEDYVAGALSVLILTPYLFIRPTGLMANHLLAALALQALMFKVNMVSVAINITMSIALVPVIGIEGAALAATTGFVVNSVLMYHYAKREVGIEVDQGAQLRLVAGSALAMVVAATVFLATEFMGLDSLFLFARLAAATLLGLGVYLAFVRKVGFFTEDEIENVRAVAKHSKLATVILKLIGH